MLYYATAGSGWINNTNWLQPSTTICDWHGVGANCSKLDLPDNNLVGVLPSNIFSGAASLRDSLTEILLQENQISGTLPKDLASLLRLVGLNVSHNNFTGSLPPDYSRWGASLRRFNADHNLLTGELPNAYQNWTRIETLTLEFNRLTGTLPEGYATAAYMSKFWVSNNFLSGTLPSAYANWTALRELRCRNNTLVGTLPDSYSAWKDIQLVLWRITASTGRCRSHTANGDPYNSCVQKRTCWKAHCPTITVRGQSCRQFSYRTID